MSLLYIIPLTEALWQPARKSTANENRRPIYVFSTDLANSAADAVLKNCYDSIVQFHNAQPKGPGYLCLSKKQEPKKAVNSTRNLSGSESEREGGARAPKRRSSRLSVSDETPATKKLRGGRQTDDAKRTRFSRRLRRQQQSSASPPSSPASDHSSSDSPASPPTSQRGRGRQRSSRGAVGRRGGQRGRGRGRRQSRRRRGGEVEEEEEEREEDSDNEDDEGEPEEEKDDGEMDESRETDDKLEAEGDGEVSAQSPEDPYDGKQDMGPRDSSMNLPQQTSSELLEEDNNYTICHGTPRTKGGRSAAVDMSSPVSQTRQPKSAALSSPAGTTPPSESSHPTPHDISSLGVADKQQKATPSNVSSITSGGRSQDPMIGGQQPHSDVHKDATAPNNWPGGLGHQFSHVPGYYGAGIHPMHYAPHATQHVPSANYSYGMYPWGAHHMGQPSRDPQHPYATHESPQHVRSAAAASSQAGHLSQSGGHASAPPAAYQRHPHTVHHSHPTASTPSETGKEMSSAGSQGHESAGATPSHEKHPHHAHSHTSLHQLSGPGSAQATALPQVHHAAFPRPPHALTTEQLSAATAVHHHPAAAAAAPFTYGFDPSNPAALSHMHHLWQQQQHQIRAAGVHPSHLPPHLQHTATAAGMWYSPHVQQLMQHGGAPLPDESAKRRALAAQSASSKHPQVDASAALRMNSNRNNNNSNTEQLSLVRGIHSPSSHSQTMLLYGNTNYVPTSQATEWTRCSTSDVQNHSHLTGSSPR